MVPAARAAYAEALLNGSRPEAALPVVHAALADLADDDPIRAEALTLKRRAEADIAAKHPPEWKPLWAATLRPVSPDSRDDPPPPVAASDLLLATEPDDRGRCQVVALDAATGQRRWTSALPGAIRDLAAAPDGRRAFCLLDSGALICLDLRNGQPRWEKPFEKDANGLSPDGLVLAGETVIVYGGRAGIAGVAAQSGELLWQQPDWRLLRMGRQIDGKPAVVGESIVVTLDDVTVRAFMAATGVEVWKRAYLSAPPPAGAPPLRRAHPSVISQPFALGGTRVLVTAYLPTLRMEALNILTGAVEQRPPALRFPNPPYRRAACADLLVEWEVNGQSAVRRLPDFSRLSTRLPNLNACQQLPISGHTAYLCDRQNTEMLAVDIETGAVRAHSPTRGAAYGAWMTLGPDKVFVLGRDGHVAAFPLLMSR
jgi:hypothetical protein